ncbi:MAG: AI-2E family transporter [Actinomycetota bacterium]
MVDRIRRAGAVCWALCGVAALIVVIGVIAWVVRVIWPPLILAGAIVFLLNPVVTRLHDRHIPRVLGTALSYLGVAAIITLAVVLVAPLATEQYDDLAAEWPELRQDLEDSIDDLSERSEEDNWPIQIPTYAEFEEQLSGDSAVDANGDGDISAEERQDRFAEQLATARELLLRVFHVGIIFVLAPIIAFYLLVDLPHIRTSARALVPERARGDVMVVSRRLSHAIGGYFRGQLAVAIVVGTMASIGMLIIDLPFWLIVGMVAGLFNMIPLIGPWVGAVPGVIIALTTGGGLSKAIAVAVVMAIVQQIDNHFISPIVMQRAVKLHPAVVMLALLAGGTLGGFFGLLLAVPATAVLKIVVGHAWRHLVLGQPLDEIEAAWEVEDAQRGVGIIEVVGRDDAESDDDVRADAERLAEPGVIEGELVESGTEEPAVAADAAGTGASHP